MCVGSAVYSKYLKRGSAARAANSKGAIPNRATTTDGIRFSREYIALLVGRIRRRKFVFFHVGWFVRKINVYRKTLNSVDENISSRL